MNEIAGFEGLLWLVTILANVVLAAVLVFRRNFRAFPLFFIYVLITTLQSGVLVVTYRLWGLDSPVSLGMYCSTQLLVILARGLAVGEICWRVLGKYRGIWALAWRTLLGSAALVLLYAVVVASFRWQHIILNADRTLQLAVTVGILLLFLFAHSYEIEMEQAVRSLAIGFFLYSCFIALNDTILEGWRQNYTALFNVLGTLSFLASLLLWTWALRKTQTSTASEGTLLPSETYQMVVPQINARLRLLNEQLSHFWHVEKEKS